MLESLGVSVGVVLDGRKRWTAVWPFGPEDGRLDRQEVDLQGKQVTNQPRKQFTHQTTCSSRLQQRSVRFIQDKS